MKKKMLISTLAILFMLSLIPMAFSQPFNQPGPCMQMKNRPLHGKGAPIPDILGLSDEQKNQIADLRLKLQKEILPLRAEIQSKMAELKILQTEANANLKKIDGKIDEISKIKARIQKARIRHRLEVRKLLTPEQQKIFDTQSLMGKRHGHKGMGQGFRCR